MQVIDLKYIIDNGIGIQAGELDRNLPGVAMQADDVDAVAAPGAATPSSLLQRKVPMRGLRWSLMAVGLAIVLPASAEAQVGDDYYDDYDLAVGEYYGTSVDRMPSWIDPDELPIIYLLAREARVSPQIIIALRERGWSWIDITYHLGVDPYIYVERMPYTTGYWRRYSSWELRYLSDRHIIDYVNLIFWADYHRRPIHQVIVIRQRVPSWRHYGRYHAPPRAVARGVYRGWSTPSSRDAVRREQARDDSDRRAIRRDGRPSSSPYDRAAPPSRTQPRATPAQGVRRDARPNNGSSRPTTQGGDDRVRDDRVRDDRVRDDRGGDARQAVRRSTGESRSEAAPSRREAAPSEREARPSRPEAAPSRGSSADRRDSGASRSTAAPASRGSASPRSSTQGARSGSTRRGGG